MKVLIVNTAEKIGGAAIAARRLMLALNNQGIEAKMLVRDKQTEQENVIALDPSPLLKAKFLWERFCIWKANHFKRQRLFWVDIANTGTDITALPEFKEADVIHLHWINQGFLSLRNIRRIIESGKPIVWTMHDMWPCTGICHHSGDCEKYHSHCHDCPLLYKGSRHDLSYATFARKKKLLKDAHIVFAACSHWLENRARQSALFANQEVTAIPNTIDTGIFHPQDKTQARQDFSLPLGKKLLLFGSLNVTDPRKGIAYLIEACRIMAEKHKDVAQHLGIVVAGNCSEQMRNMFPFPVYPVGYVHDEKKMATLYNAVDAFVTPSLEENLPNTIVESLCCGLPCIGFNVGGIPEMIEHRKNGYLAQLRDAGDLAAGIRFVVAEASAEELSANALHFALAHYGEKNVVERYVQAYQRAGERK